MDGFVAVFMRVVAIGLQLAVRVPKVERAVDLCMMQSQSFHILAERVAQALLVRRSSFSSSYILKLVLLLQPLFHSDIPHSIIVPLSDYKDDRSPGNLYTPSFQHQTLVSRPTEQ